MFNADVKKMTSSLTLAKRLTRVWGACSSSLEYLKVIGWDIKAVVATPAADGIAAHQARAENPVHVQHGGHLLKLSSNMLRECSTDGYLDRLPVYVVMSNRQVS